jgi:hypothetical protein
MWSATLRRDAVFAFAPARPYPRRRVPEIRIRAEDAETI